MFDFHVLQERAVRVLMKDGTWYAGRYRAILSEWAEAKPTLWLTDWSNEYFVTLDRIAELQAA